MYSKTDFTCMSAGLQTYMQISMHTAGIYGSICNYTHCQAMGNSFFCIYIYTMHASDNTLLPSV